MIRLYSFTFIVCFLLSLPISVAAEEQPILIINSYTADSHITTANVSNFIEEFHFMAGNTPVIVEGMNCKSFAESTLWKERMKNILSKYCQSETKPKLIVILGQEAYASFLSQDEDLCNTIPVIVTQVSRNVVALPYDSTSLETWMPECADLFRDYPDKKIRGGVVYYYDVVQNIELIKKLYPQTQNIALITDNSYGGVAMQAHVREVMSDYPELNLLLLDGRKHTVYTIIDELCNLPDQTVILLGTWRIDKDDSYLMPNATYGMMDTIPNIPTFSISAIGMNYWAIGGVVPMYSSQGKILAEQAYAILSNPLDTITNHFATVQNRLKLDYNKVADFSIDISKLPSDVIFINKGPSFYEEYKFEVGIVISILVTFFAAFLVVLFFYFRTKRLKDQLLISESELRIAKDKAEEANNLKSAFLANMSHEIRTPLNSIVGFSNVIAAGIASEEEMKTYAEIIQTNSDLLLRLINDILDLSKLESGKVSFAYETVNITEVIQQVLTSIEFVNTTRNNNLIFETDYTEYEIETDVQRFQQVLINLLSNASKFTENGHITVAFNIDEDKKQAIFSISDTGPGIPQDKQSLIFERFEKLNDYVQGTGLGLAICKLIVTKLGGTIFVDSTYKDGARFVFTHPIPSVK